MKHMPYVLALSLTLLCSFASMASAQETTGTIVGTARDETGAALPGVTVTARNQQTNLTREVVSAEDGGYSISHRPAFAS